LVREEKNMPSKELTSVGIIELGLETGPTARDEEISQQMLRDIFLNLDPDQGKEKGEAIQTHFGGVFFF